jgi:hypothetical protein
MYTQVSKTCRNCGTEITRKQIDLITTEIAIHQRALRKFRNQARLTEEIIEELTHKRNLKIAGLCDDYCLENFNEGTE